MTHRGDSDWHGWPLQEIVDQVAQKHYAKMREAWPEALRKDTAEHLTQTPPEVQRQVKEAVLPAVVDVLDVVNTLDHPVVTELRVRLMAYDAEIDEALRDDSAHDLELIALALIVDIREIAARGQED